MAALNYEYHGLMASTWDLFRGDTSQWPDRFFFRELIARHGQPVLDVGCATGRLLLDFMAEGIDIDGVDQSPEILQICREKADRAGLSPHLYCQAMESLELPRTYSTLLIPSSSFQLLTDTVVATQAIKHLFGCVSPGGVLVMPFMTLWQEGEPLEKEWELTGEKIRPHDGAMVRRWSRSRFDPVEGCEHTQDRYEAEYGGKVIAAEEHQRSPATRSYTQGQALSLYHEAGFVDIQMYSGFTFEPVQLTDKLFSIVGRTPCIKSHSCQTKQVVQATKNHLARN